MIAAWPGQIPAEVEIVAITRAWLEQAVIGLNLCPFAKSVHVKNQVEYRISKATDTDSLLEDLVAALQDLRATPPEQTDTTLLIHPWVLQDFLEYNDFLAIADVALQALGLEGELQIASFHPHYQFADTDADDIGNCSNRAPFPTLHLIREESIAKAVAAVPDAADIFERNIDTLETLGPQGWRALLDRILQARRAG